MSSVSKKLACVCGAKQVLFSASIIKRNAKAYEAVVEGMKNGATVDECIKAIEAA